MRDHRSLIAWQRARDLARLGIRVARHNWRPFAAGAFSQLQRASLSVQLNIAEGYARNSPAQFRQYLTVAYGSAVEAGEVLELLVAEGLIEEETGRQAIGLAEECQRLLLGLLKRYKASAAPNP